MPYYVLNNKYYASVDELPLPEVMSVPKEEDLTFLRQVEPASNRFRFVATKEAQLTAPDGLEFLDSRRIASGTFGEIPEEVRTRLQNGGISVENFSHPLWHVHTADPMTGKWPVRRDGTCRLHVAALGDVGSTMLIALKLLGADVLTEIGLYDLNDKLSSRWEMELNQMSYPFEDKLPPVKILKDEEVFDCEVFVFAATASIPPVGSDVKDVRLVQFEANRRIMKIYAKKAREANYRGLFCALSDPVDLLARSAYELSNCDENGVYDGKGLLPEQVHGYGLGVMNARAAYFAEKIGFRDEYFKDSRAYGPHGKGLVIADSVDNYNAERSLYLTEKAIAANLEVRDLGYKPYAAPAVSSGALSILLTIRGDWHYSSVPLNKNYLGVRNRLTDKGLVVEERVLPDALYARIADAEAINNTNYASAK